MDGATALGLEGQIEILLGVGVPTDDLLLTLRELVKLCVGWGAAIIITEVGGVLEGIKWLEVELVKLKFVLDGHLRGVSQILSLFLL